MDAAAGTSPTDGWIDGVDYLNPHQAWEVGALLAAAAQLDGREAVSEQGRLRLRADEQRAGVRHLLQYTGAEVPVSGYAQLDGSAKEGEPTAEFVVAPAYRGLGLGRALLAAVRQEADGPVQIWSHGGHPGARRLAQTHGAQLVRELRQMRRTGKAPDAVALPEGVQIRTFRVGADEDAWLRLNALAFAHHPEQGSWTRQDLEDRIAEPWFDPAGFLLAVRGEKLVGFHWTKVARPGPGEPELGEVYVVGVDPAEQGNGLGRALTAAGLRYLAHDRRLETVLLYVDADNPAAVRVYERLGFTVHEVDLMYRFAAADPTTASPAEPRAEASPQG